MYSTYDSNFQISKCNQCNYCNKYEPPIEINIEKQTKRFINKIMSMNKITYLQLLQDIGKNEINESILN